MIINELKTNIELYTDVALHILSQCIELLRLIIYDIKIDDLLPGDVEDILIFLSERELKKTSLKKLLYCCEVVASDESIL
jgi:hypothetical protein